ncbi:MAG TPA: MaoC family dehydratase [Alphaproteobacteria bacterium]|jgi:acyl dehydratase|nr:MaoC family dehydratase [Alphaproteobacteria bacterium]
MLYLEDFTAGDTRTFGTKIVTEPEILAFGTEFDPQYFHTDPERAQESSFGGLIASGWHTVSMTCRMFVDNYMNGTSLIGGIGADEVRWLLPVRPGDTLSVRTTVLAVQRSRSKPDRGSVVIAFETFNQAGAQVLAMKVTALLGARPPIG